jgi:hypothetical protein
MAWLRVAVFAALAVAFAAVAAPARGGERELQLTLGPGYSSLAEVGDGLDGLGGGGEVSYGLSSFWSLAAGSFIGFHFAETLDETTYDATRVINVWVGPRFNLDVFVIIPFISLAPELLFADGVLAEDREELDFGLRWTVGFDYRPKRNWSLGLEVNYHSFLDEPLNYPVYVTTLFRLSYHHDFGAL